MQWIVFLACDITWPCAEQMAATCCSPWGLILKQNLSLADLSQENRLLTPSLSCTDDESPGLYGFLNVIVHSATGFKQSSSKWLVWGGRCQSTELEAVRSQGRDSDYHRMPWTLNPVRSCAG